jgi:DNA-binding transcriptional MerR regulator
LQYIEFNGGAMKKFYTARETAEMLGLTTQAIHWAARNGTMQFEVQNGQRVFASKVVRDRIEREVSELEKRLGRLRAALNDAGQET